MPKRWAGVGEWWEGGLERAAEPYKPEMGWYLYSGALLRNPHPSFPIPACGSLLPVAVSHILTPVS